MGPTISSTGTAPTAKVRCGSPVGRELAANRFLPLAPPLPVAHRAILPFSRAVKQMLAPYMRRGDRILVPGCGNSTLGRDLYRDGFRDVTCIDISRVCVVMMEERLRTLSGVTCPVLRRGKRPRRP